MKGKVQKWSGLVGPIAALFVALGKAAPAGLTVMIVLFVVLVIVFLLLPWHYRSWTVAEDPVKSRAQRSLGVIHAAVLCVGFGLPVLGVVGYFAVSGAPRWLSEAYRSALVALEKTEGPPVVVVLPEAEVGRFGGKGCLIGVVKGGSLAVAPAVEVTQVVLSPWLDAIISSLSTGWMLLLVILLGMKFADMIGGIAIGGRT